MTLTLNPGSGKTEVAITYLSGAIRHAALDWRTPGFGILMTPLMGNVPERPGLHAHDNGVFSEFQSKGKKAFNLARFLAHLDAWRGVQHMCLFAVAPDVIAPWQAAQLGLASSEPWQATLERSAPVLPEIRKRGYRAALVAQNGLERHMDEIPWDTFDVLFLGGGQDKRYVRKGNPKGEWKLSQGARRLVAAARRQGKDVHMGRVNSGLRIRLAQEMGCTSADGTCIAMHPRGPVHAEAEVRGWLADRNTGLPAATTACYVCRCKAQAWADAYHTTVDKVLAGFQCQHVARPAPRPLQLPIPTQLPAAA